MVTDVGLRDMQQLQQWVIRIQAAVGLVLDLNQQLDEYSVQKHFALASGNKRVVLRMEALANRHTKELAPVVGKLLCWTASESVDEVLKLLVDITAILTLANVEYERWRTALARPANETNMRELDAARAAFVEYVTRARGLVPSLDEVNAL